MITQAQQTKFEQKATEYATQRRIPRAYAVQILVSKGITPETV